MPGDDLQPENERLRRELDELERANRELLVYKQQLDAILNNAPVEIYLKDREGRYLRINREFERIFGVRNEELVGLFPADVHDPELAVATRQHDLQVLQHGVAIQLEQEALLVHDQQWHTLLTIKFPVFNDQGEIDGLGAVVTDITERKQLEDSLRRAQRMETVGQLTGGIAHDFNNILGIVMGNLELMENLLAHDEKLLRLVQSAYKGASRGAELTHRLLGFSRTRPGLVKCVSLNGLIRAMEALLAKSLTASISTRISLQEDLWSVEIDPGEFEDAILNLSLNARDAMPAGGELVISTSNQVIDDGHPDRQLQISSGEYVMLSVLDNGHGMTPEVSKRATEPFFTTKGASGGTGLGLSMVYGFLHRSGGQLEIISAPGEGCEVRLYLPRAGREVDTAPADSRTSELQYGYETILIVDDETALVDIAVSNLRDLGYETFTASDSQAALELLEANANIDLLFADVIMPGAMNGYELAMAARQVCPALKVLITSGFTSNDDMPMAAEAEYRAGLLDNLLRKPYDKASLSTAVRRVLDREDTQRSM
ncbi:MAG: PAS domain-containing protein [Granulosicoccus sp.]|nr:PAS domain-containing protein [Granulosicoccus sp.]